LKVDGVENSLLGIGAMAQASGLSVSALRFYDNAGVLVPASVDPYNGYRRYSRHQVVDARMLAHLRRVGVALVDLRRVLSWRLDPEEARAVLDAHVQRLELGLTDARRELSMVRTLIDQKEIPVLPGLSVHCDAVELLAAVRAVRFAVGTSPELPVLSGVLFDFDAELTLVATDRYRLAVATVALPGPVAEAVQAVVPVTVVDALVLLLSSHSGTVLLQVDDGISFTVGSQVLRTNRLELPYPDYRQLTARLGGRRVPVGAPELRTAVAASTTRTMVREQDGVSYDVVELLVGEVNVSVVDASVSTGSGIGVNREFLLQALEVAGDGQLMLELDGPIAPLAIRPADVAAYSLLMPTRLG
jgi:DNA polymerase-3 subunit beta